MKQKIVVIGDITLDMISDPLNNLPEEDTEIFTSFTPKLGGQAAHCALGLSRLGIKTKLVGAVGDDPRSALIINRLKKEKNLELKLQKKKKTAVSFIATTKGKRTIFNDPGANAEFNLSSLKDIDVDYLFLGGFWHLKNFDFEKVLTYAKKNNIITFMDFGWSNVMDKTKIKKIFEKVDYVFLNKKELFVFTNEKNIERALKKIDTNLALHLGREGSLFYSKGKKVKVTTKKTDLHDVTGAGDYWNAGFIYGTIQEWPIEKRLDFANKFVIKAINSDYHELCYDFKCAYPVDLSKGKN